MKMKKGMMVVITLTLALCAALFAFVYPRAPQAPKTDAKPTQGNVCPVAAVGASDRNYLPLGTIYAFPDDPDRHYHVVDSTIHLTSDQLAKFVCFETEAEAKAAGYTPDETLIEEKQGFKDPAANIYDIEAPY
jgi:hypothetical protein